MHIIKYQHDNFLANITYTLSKYKLDREGHFFTPVIIADYNDILIDIKSNNE